jgi:opacity protein-like surface antigen
MKGLLKGVAAFSLMAALGASSAHAQNLMTIGVGGGITIPTGTTSDALKTGWNAEGVFQYKPATSPVGLQIDGMYQQLKANATGTAAGLDKEKIWSGTGNIVFWFPTSKETKIRPYVLGGGGVYNLKDVPTAAAVAAGATSASVTKFGINAGAGFDFDIQSNVAFFVEGRFHNVFISGGNAHFIPITAGFRFKA